MHYSQHASHVRVAFFKVRGDGCPGKWYTDEEVVWPTERYNGILLTCFAQVLEQHLRSPEGGHRLTGTWAVCLEPYHEHAYPVAMNVDEAISDAKAEAKAKKETRKV